MVIRVPEKIEDIFNTYKSRVYRLALSITRNEKDAEDIVQNAFYKITKNLGQFRHESSISTWIYRIAYNEALMFLRKRKRQYKFSAAALKEAGKNHTGIFVNWAKLPDEQLLDREFKERVEAAIKHLPIKYRMPLLLNNAEGFSVRDAAFVLGLKENSLKTRIHRARLMLRGEMVRYFKDQEAKAEPSENACCQSWMRFIYDYAAGNLEPSRQRSFRAHISDCKPCKEFLFHYRKVIGITKALQCQDIPLKLQHKIETFISQKRCIA